MTQKIKQFLFILLTTLLPLFSANAADPASPVPADTCTLNIKLMQIDERRCAGLPQNMLCLMQLTGRVTKKGCGYRAGEDIIFPRTFMTQEVAKAIKLGQRRKIVIQKIKQCNDTLRDNAVTASCSEYQKHTLQ